MTTENVDTTAVPDTGTARAQQLYRVLAWVGIVAGVVFIVGVVFCSGFVLAGGYRNWHRGPAAGPMGGCPMMQGEGMTGGMKGGMMGGMMPGGMMPGGTMPGGTMPGGPTWPGTPDRDQAGPAPAR